MGFYGNITNINRTQFVFDKIYSNRKQMDEACAKINENTGAYTGDSVLIGRYVLVDYDQDFPGNNYARLYIKELINGSKEFYFTSNFAEKTKAKIIATPYYNADGTVTEEKRNEDTAQQSWQEYILFDQEPVYVWDEKESKKIFYKANYNPYKFIEMTKDSTRNTNSYYENYLIDQGAYQNIGRGWDSTVWQKTYVNNEIKYVMVAELNGVTPTFDLTVDAPTLEPIKPHFDADSTNVYYKLHVQPNWGFKIAEAGENEDSDENVYSALTDYSLGWDSDLQQYINTPKTPYKGKIYFNKKGFDPAEGYVRTDKTDNSISVGLSKSGRKYNNVHSSTNENGETSIVNIPTAKNDTQELSIELPGIGNAVATMWDIVYGENKSGKARNQNISWNNISGNRLVNAQPEGNGFTYDTKKVETLAGCINSVHDLMGMIILDNVDDVNEALSNRIYYRKNENGEYGYYYKKLTYYYQEDNIVDPVELQPFTDDIYYESLDNLYNETLENYDTDNRYYKIPADKVTPMQFSSVSWHNSDYSIYYVGENGDLIYKPHGEDEPRDDLIYYVIDHSEVEKSPAVQNVYQNYSTIPSKCFMPGNYPEEVYNEIFPETKTAGLFYYSWDPNNSKKLLKKYSQSDEQCQKLTKGTQFAYVDGYTVEYKVEAGTNEIKPMYIIETEADGGAAIIYNRFEMVDFEENRYYSWDEDKHTYVLLQSLADVVKGIIYYDFKDSPNGAATKVEGRFFNPKRYYYKDNKNYIKEGTSTEPIPGKQYVEIDKECFAKDYAATFYEPNKYYYQDNITGEWILDTNATITEGRKYYKDTFTKYVIEDTANELRPGSTWSLPESINIPDSLTLGVRKEQYKWEELKGFARTLNTIHGLILNINKLLNINDNFTRDTKTVQGCINTLNDIISHFDMLLPGPVIINQYGKLSPAIVEQDNWVNYQTDPKNEKIIINHGDPAAIKYTQKPNNTPQFGGNFTFEDHWFDNKGHKFATATRTVTLPKGSLTDAIKTDSDVITQLQFTEATGALVSTRENISKLKLAGYAQGEDRAILAQTDTVGQAFGKLQNQIADEVTARQQTITNEVTSRSNADAELNTRIDNLTLAANESSTLFISKISQDKGKIAVERSAAGTLVLGDLYSKATAETDILPADSINSAFGKVAYKLDNLKQTNIKINQNIQTLQENLNGKQSAFSVEKIAQWDAAEPNVQADWNVTDTESDAYIANKPDLSIYVKNEDMDNIVQTTTKFSYSINEGTSSEKTIQEMFDYIVTLEQRIALLEETASS